MPLGFGSIKDLAKVIRGPLWLIAGAVALGVLIAAFRCR